jgi:hypothetical protein
LLWYNLTPNRNGDGEPWVPGTPRRAPRAFSAQDDDK